MKRKNNSREQVKPLAGSVKQVEREQNNSKNSVLQNDVLSKILRGTAFVFGIYLIIKGSNLFLKSSSWSFVLQDPSYILSSFFGFLLVLAAIVPKKFVINQNVPSSPSDMKNFFISIEDEKAEQVRRSNGISWKINYPKNLPNPVQKEDSVVYDFLIELEIKNNTSETLELRAQIESINQGIAFISSDKEEEWNWTPLPHYETRQISLEDEIETRILEKEQSTKFHFHAVYRPHFSTQFFPGYMFLNYMLKGEFSSGEKFSSGSQRIEVPFARGDGR